jgi:hypothetical protein
MQIKKLKALAEGEVALTISGGGVVAEASASSLVTSVSKDYQPMFDLDTSTSWKLDADRADVIANDRS